MDRAMTGADDELVEKMARAIRSSIQYEVEPDVRANQMTDEELATIARAALSVARAAIKEECARVAERYVINKRELHPDVPFEDISQQYKNTVHAGAQYIADAIRAMEK